MNGSGFYRVGAVVAALGAFQLAMGGGIAGTTFTDVTGGGAGDVLPVLEPWVDRTAFDADSFAQTTVAVSIMVGPGGAVGDFDRDGDPDYFAVGGMVLGDRVLVNKVLETEGVFVDSPGLVGGGVGRFHLGNGACVGDMDGDGWPDVLVLSLGRAPEPTTGGHIVYRNLGEDGGGEWLGFEATDSGSGFGWAEVAGVHTTCVDPKSPTGTSATFGDPDLDGDLDLMLGGWRISGDNDGENRVFSCQGPMSYADVGVGDAALSAALESTHTFAPRFIDMDGDRYPELLLCADFESGKYMINVPSAGSGSGVFGARDFDIKSAADAGFEWLGMLAGTRGRLFGMGSAIGDFDNNGYPDWFMTSIYDPPNPSGEDNGNRLVMNWGGHSLSEHAVEAGVADGDWGWGATAADFNHDGLEDIVMVNRCRDESSAVRVFVNQGDTSVPADGVPDFVDMSAAWGLVQAFEDRAVSVLDYDLDGDMDVMISPGVNVVQNDGPGCAMEPVRGFTLWRNDLVVGGATPSDGHWVKAHLDTGGFAGLAPDGIGARVVARTGAEYRARWIDSGSTYLGQCELVAHFGLGSAALVDEFWVQWPDGTGNVRAGLGVDQSLVISPLVDGDSNLDGAVDVNDISHVLFRLGDPVTTCCTGGDVNGDMAVDVNDISYVLFRLGTADRVGLCQQQHPAWP